MITDLILGALIGVARALLTLMPTWGPDLSGLATVASTIGSTASMINGYFPVGPLFLGIAVIWGYRLILMGWNALRTAWELVPFN